MSNITIGQYYNVNSIIHKLDPRVKLFGTLIFIVALFVANNSVSYAIITFSLVAVIIASKVPFIRLIKGMKQILIILIISSLCNMFFVKSGNTLVHFGAVNITSGGVIKAAYIGLRLIYLVIGTSVMTLTTKPSDMADGLEKSLGFLKVIKIPVHEIAMMMSLALRFIPTLMEETDKIIKAQTARGADFESGGLIRKVKNYIPILVPLFVSSIERALELATAMEARCYRGGVRTKFRPLKYNKTDIIAYGVQILFLAGIICANLLS
ncbi:MAG: energy-coupling factor transporter transmembrane protein EcfT [Lachnospiraceae bacterium]|nr:energy-coupling factor transporter transmembrane protein EcfT [Lachnospiraceae bacterium]